MPNARSSISEHQFVMIIPSALAVGEAFAPGELLVGVDVGRRPAAARWWRRTASRCRTTRCAVRVMARTGPTSSSPTLKLGLPLMHLRSFDLVPQHGQIVVGRHQPPVRRAHLEVVPEVRPAALDVLVDDVAGHDDLLADIGRAVVLGVIFVVDARIRPLHAGDPLLLVAIRLEDAHLVDVDHRRRPDLPPRRIARGVEELARLLACRARTRCT